MSDQRDGVGILRRLSETLGLSIQHAIFTSYSDNIEGMDYLWTRPNKRSNARFFQKPLIVRRYNNTANVGKNGSRELKPGKS